MNNSNSKYSCAYLITPGVYWTSGSISSPSLPFDLEILKTANDMAMERNRDVSATSFPGHILPRFQEQGQWIYTKLMDVNTFSQIRML